MAAIGITGNVRSRFIQVAALLHMLDPVRGEPTVYGLDQDLCEITTPRERLLKRKFLDSFALVCATKRNGDTVSAACLEEGRPQGTVIRIASNSGVSEKTLSGLRELVGALNVIASGALDSADRETDILLRIIRLDISKIRQYLKKLCATKGIFEEAIPAIESRITTSSSNIALSSPQPFLEWFRHIFTVYNLPIDAEPEVLVDHIKWAQEARRYYFDFLKAAFSTKDQPLPGWVLTIFKLGRYGIASRALVQLASELPALFNPMTVESLIAPPKTSFTIPETEMPLSSVLRRVIPSRVEEFIPRLASIWNTANAETFFRRVCSMDLVVHAEMQLVNFYDHNPQYKPTFRFIGISKKSCYLCHLFLTTHPESFCVSSCHQKLYLSWIPSPATDPKVYKRYKATTTELSKVMEATARRDLDGRLGTKRNPIPADSTAGVSLSGLTESRPVQTATQTLARSQVALIAEEGPIVEGEIVVEEETVVSLPSFQPIEVVSLTPPNLEVGPSASGERGLPDSTRHFSKSDRSISSMVFHFMRAGDAIRQDIICVGDILNHSTGNPSWEMLVELLRVDDGFGLAFQEGSEYLMVNNRILVANERQFLACIQYLHNLDIFSSEVFVYAAD